jgi:hypothetical protein
MKTLKEVIAELREKSTVGKPGMMGREVVVDKQLLREAQVYLEDYLAVLEGDV